MTRQLDKIPDISRQSGEDIEQRMRRDLASAAQVQKSMLPAVLPSVPGYSFWAAMEPFSEMLGGDLYDFHTLSTGEILVVVSDVAGKGVSAAVGMAALAGIITMAVEAFGPDLVAVMKAVNRAYYKRMAGSDRFATLMAVALDWAAHRLRAVNAGHSPGVIRRRNGTIEGLATLEAGMPFGILEEADYKSVSAELGPGDAVFIASDGISDASNSQNEVYGTEQLHKVLARTEGEAATLAQYRPNRREPTSRICKSEYFLAIPLTRAS